MKQKLLLVIAIVFFSITSSAQYTWYDTSTSTFNTPYDGVQGSSSVELRTVTNPATTGINSSVKTNQFNKGANIFSWMSFSLPNPILAADVPTTEIKLKVYFAEYDDLPATEKTLQVYLRNSALATTNQKSSSKATMIEADEGVWVEYTFDFTTTAGTTFNDEYDSVIVYFAIQDEDTATYLFDGLSGNSDQSYTLSPASATLDTDNSWYYNYSPDAFVSTITAGGSGSVLETGQTSPTTVGNDSPTVSKFTKTAGSSASHLNIALPTEITEENKNLAIFKIRIHAPSTSTGNSLRLNLRKDGQTAGPTQITNTISTVRVGAWEEYTFDFSNVTFKHTSYDRALIFIIDSGNTNEASENIYYFDALQGPSSAVLALDDELQLEGETTLKVYPNPTDNTLNINVGATSLNIYNMLGQLVNTYENTKQIDVSNYKNGIYMLQAKLENNKVETLRFVKK